MLTHKLAKAILHSPVSGEMTDEVTISWVKKTVYTWPMCHAQTKFDIYVDDMLVETCDLSWIRECANG